jgi:arylsulfatase A-like enzyme
VDQPKSPAEGYHLTEDLTDKAMEFIKDAKSVAPDKPFFLYYAPGAAHAPHHAPKEWIAKFKGQFDMGYEAMREQTLARQKEMGIVPADTELPPVNPIGTSETRTGPKGQPFPPLDVTRPWDSLSADEKRLFARMAEVYAGFLAHADHHIGRLLDYLEEFGHLENTMVVVVSDNGASGEGGPNGSVNEMLFANGIPDTIQANLAMLDELGGTKTYNHYPNGWAMAFNTPFKMWKRYEFNGGTADPCIISWPSARDGATAGQGEIRHQYHHAIDIVPTILDALGVETPETIKGHVQSRFDGVSMRYSVGDPSVSSARKTQFYSMLGSRAIWHEGWKAVTTHPTISGWSDFNDDTWELYHTDVDRSELHDLAAERPEKVRELVNLWFAEAGENNAFPLDDRSAVEIITTQRPQLATSRDRYIYFPDTAEVPEAQAVNVRNRSYSIGALVDIPAPGAEGVLFAHGSRFGGHALYVKDNRLHYVYNFVGMIEQKIDSTQDLPTGQNLILSASFDKDGEDPPHVSTGILSLYHGDKKVAEGRIKTQPGMFMLAGEGLCVGRDSGEAVTTDYPNASPHRFTGGTIKRVAVDVSGDPYVDLEREAVAMLARE